jgi:transposase
MQSITTIGLDIAKSVFQVHGVDAGAVARLVGIEGGVVSEEFNLESSGVEAPDRRPRHDQPYYEP